MYDGVGDARREKEYNVVDMMPEMRGKVDFFNVHIFYEKGLGYINGILPGDTCRFNLSKIENANTSLVATITELYKKCKKEDIEMKVIGMNKNFKNVLKMCKIEELPIFSS